MEELQIFSNAEFGDVRTILRNGEPMFCLADACRVLDISNPSKAKTRLREDGVTTSEGIDSLGRTQTLNFISEPNLYKLIFQSRKAEAERFANWVTSEVLPSIRKTGAYSVQVPRTLKEALQLALEQEEKLEALQLDNSIKTQQIAELQPKATYYDLILQCRDLLSMTEIAKDYGMSAKGMNKKLHELGVQYNQSGVWFLYAKYQSEGYTQTKTQNYNRPDGTQGSRTHMYWTQKGRLFLYDFLKAKDVLPMIERTE